MAAHSAPASSSLGRGGSRLVGDYMFGRQIGSGSFSVVWHARHRLRGTEVAVKEIVMDRLSKKLQDSLLSEIVILKRISHPNIISLYDIIEASGRIYLVLEYCRGGDLSMYLQRNGRVSEATSKHFMQQLAAGLQVLRENNLIHRDLKPQNLLLTTYDENSVLKIADFGFARSLQPRGLAETLCGSPLYMAPEIMQLQKYDAKADLWSVGAIFFQLVTGKTPFTGSNQIQLLQNIIKSTDLLFPPDNNLSYECIDLCQKLLRRNPVERLTFQEFFDHPFLSQRRMEKSLSRTSSSTRDGFPPVESSPARHSVGSSQDECLPFHLDDESSGQDGSPSVPKGFVVSTYGSSFDSGIHRSPASSPSKIGLLSRISSHKCESSNYRHDSRTLRGNDSRTLRGNVGETKLATEQRRLINFSLKDPTDVDPLEFIEQEYVLVSGPPVEMAFSSPSISQQRNPPCISESPPVASPKFSSPMLIIGAAARDTDATGSMESRGSPASVTSQGSMDMGGAIEQPSANCMTRIRSLQQCASVITELVRDEVGSGRRLQAFSIQLVLLAIWKQALHICHAQAASAIEGSPSRGLRIRDSYTGSPEMQHCNADPRQMDAVCSQIEKEFLDAIGRAEDLARELGQADETAEMPDAMEIVYESALSLGRHGAVDEMMMNTERAASRYSKALCMMQFLLVEAPSLVLNPPFSLTNSDRYRLRSYINVLTNRQSQSTSPRSSLLKCEDN